MKNVTLKQIADSVGVSERLVAYALNGNGRVGVQTRRRIVDIAQQLGYRPNRAARTLATGKSGMLALCLPELATAYGDAITRIVEARSRTSDFDLVVTRMAAVGSGKSAALVPSGLAQVDGAFLLEPPRLPLQAELSVIRNAVVIGVCQDEGVAAFDHVRVDLTTAATQAVSTLLSRSPRLFAYMTTDDLMPQSDEPRYNAYLDGVAAAGLQPLIITLGRQRDLFSDSAAALLDYVTRHECPDAIMCSNDEIAIGAMRALRQLGKSVPHDVSLTGCDGIACAQDVCPPLSTIAQPFEEMMDLAWEFLMRRLATPEEHLLSAVIQARFIERETSKTRTA